MSPIHLDELAHPALAPFNVESAGRSFEQSAQVLDELGERANLELGIEAFNVLKLFLFLADDGERQEKGYDKCY